MNCTRSALANHRAVLLGSLAAGVLFLAGMAQAANEVRLRTITVSGHGEVRAEPDRAIVQLGAESRRPALDEARAEVAGTVDAVLELTRDLQIEAKHVRATRINVQPEYSWDNDSRERRLIGYYVSRQIEIDLRDLDKLGRLLERSIDLGINQVGEPRLDSSKRRELERAALARAVEDARLNAMTVAQAANAHIGAPRTISAGANQAQPLPAARMQAVAMAEAVDASKNYQSGQMTFNGVVQIQYDLIVSVEP